MAGLTGSDLRQVSDFKPIVCPFTGREWTAIPAIAPDWTVIHVHEADAAGNARMYGPKYDDVYKAKAARNVLVTAERIVDGAELARQPELTDIPGFLVTAVVHAPGGAAPHSCQGHYPADEAFFARYLQACAAGAAGLDAFLKEVLA